MTNKDIENKIKSAVERLTPDALEDILGKCDDQTNNIYILQPKKRGWGAMRAVSAIAAALVMTIGGVFAYNRIGEQTVDALVMLDVNPSIEIRINKNEKVLGVDAKNEDAVKILDNMDLTNTHINVAVNALVGSMLKFGYIQENANSILLSVEGNDHEKSVLLQRNLTQSISAHLNAANGAVISQALSPDEALRELADENQISFGKAALIQTIVDANSHLLFEDLASLSVNELNLLVGSKQIEATGLEAQGVASDAGYIGYDKAVTIALEHAGMLSNTEINPHVEMDYDDGEMVYDVEFTLNNTEYEYEINAIEGAIIDYSQEKAEDEEEHPAAQSAPVKTPQTETGQSTPQDDGFIGEDAAREIAASHRGIAPHAGMQAEMDKDDGLYVYEVEFDIDGKEYGYEIDASTGKILSWEEDD